MSESTHDCILLCGTIQSYVNSSLLPISVLKEEETKNSPFFQAVLRHSTETALKIRHCLAFPCALAFYIEVGRFAIVFIVVLWHCFVNCAEEAAIKIRAGCLAS